MVTDSAKVAQKSRDVSKEATKGSLTCFIVGRVENPYETPPSIARLWTSAAHITAD
jgi:hypothetical protein